MKNRLTISILIYLTSAMQIFAVEMSEITNGLYLAIGAWRQAPTSGQLVTNETIRFDDKIAWCVFFKDGKMEINYPDAIHGVKIKMLDSDGNELAKTELGKSFGSKWEHLHSYKNTKLGSIDAWGEYNPYQNWRFLSPPQDLFVIKKPGIYTLEIQMQMFRHSGSGDPDVWFKNLIHFSPVKIKVEKQLDLSPNVQTNLPSK